MGMTPNARWKAITESQFSWEREALEYLRERLPDHEPWRAWANFEFIADDELVEITPKSIRVRKRFLKEHERKRASREEA